MRNFFFHLVVLLLLGQSFPVFPQPGVAVMDVVEKEKENFVRNLSAISDDPVIVDPLTRHFESEIDRIYTVIRTKNELPLLEKEKAVRSLVFFIKELGKNIMLQRSRLYEIPGALHAYGDVLNALLYDKPLPPVLGPLGPNHSQLMAASFSQYKEHALIEDIAVYKRIASSPEFILQFLENKPGFRFADSLLLRAAAHDPWKLIYYLDRNRSGVRDKIRHSTHIYLKQIASLSGDKNVSELLPFITQVAEGKITPDSILQKRTEALAYFQLLINMLQEQTGRGEADIIFKQPLRKGIKQKALSFYVNEINELHSAPDPVRFASVKGLRPQDIYYIITSSGEELYTSSFLGLYKRLMENFKGPYADSLFDIVQYDDLRTFIRLSATYNVIGDLLQRLSAERAKEILRRFIGGIESDENTALERAMDIADSFTALGSAPEISGLIQNELQSNLNRCKASQNYLGTRLYDILSGMLNLVKQKEGMQRLWTILGNYELLKKGSLENENGEIVQLVLFYGDEDGVASFNNFLKLYTDSHKWEITKNENWVSIRSLSGAPLVIYANRPLDSESEMDLLAQDSLSIFLTAQSLKPTILVHRGHSYHLDKTLKRLTPSVKLAILGSCGSYNRSISIAGINPDVQVIGSRKTGSKSVNDPIIAMINETLLSDKDLYWPEIWKSLAKRFMKDGAALSMFNEYFPPNNTLGLFVLKLFNYYKRIE
jgi:hypothetical protein